MIFNAVPRYVGEARSIVLQKICSVILLGLVLGSAAGTARAQSDDNPDESSIRKAARLRQYPGGVDEEPLKVQDPLPQIKKDGDNELAPPEPADAD